MSNHLAIATVTAALRDRLTEELKDFVSGVSVSTGRPQAPSSSGGTPTTTSAGVNIFLYQVTPNAARRNADAPTRSANGQLLQRPKAALDLHYLLSFSGDEATLRPQMLLGAVTQLLHSRPELTREQIQQTLLDTDDPDLKPSDLADAIDTVRFTLVTLSADELNRLWSLFQTPYVLSVAYQASVVLIESRDLTPSPLPVTRPVIAVLPLHQPVIERVLSQAPGAGQPIVEGQPILVGHRLVLRGRELMGATAASTSVRLGDTSLPLSADPQSDTQLTVVLPGTLRAGVQAVQVVQTVDLGEPPTPHPGVESGLATFVLRPKAAFSKSGADLRVDLEPPVRKGQRVVLLLNRLGVPAGTEAEAFGVTRTATADAASLTFTLPTVVAGDYLLRVQVDGAESPVDLELGQPRMALP
ncbi:DUF4255 domain-containing protein [Archangium lansingense]|uniref:DUF4255 domain-containing protein n=1 Tax=Archangium lansingense TaxID=2995310 RepID=A0ABT4AAN8_9BACT|nr:DUF4255 domain-containing protein [Archangium lansinium]MCY1078710.1 DUF4255 domain-containing protein [Archangium lansinium]